MNWIKRRRKKLYKTAAALLLLMWTFSLAGMTAAAADSAAPSVEITVLSGKETDKENFTASVSVKFSDLSCYNDEVYLSYHIYEKLSPEKPFEEKGFENERVKIDLDGNGSFRTDFNISLDGGAGQYYIVFDIVDQKNLYWMGVSGGGMLRADNIVYKRDVLSFAVTTLKNAVKEHYFLFALNAAVFITTVYAAVYVKKNRLLTFKRPPAKSDNGEEKL